MRCKKKIHKKKGAKWAPLNFSVWLLKAYFDTLYPKLVK